MIKNPLPRRGANAFWAGLYDEVDRELLINGVNTMLQVAAKLLLPKDPTEGQKRLKLRDDEDRNM